MKSKFIRNNVIEFIFLSFLFWGFVSCQKDLDPGNWDLHFPIIDITYNPSSPSRGDTVEFQAKEKSGSSAVVKWAWNFGDSVSTAGMTVTHVFDTAGTYTVTLIGTDKLGNTNSATQKVTVLQSAFQGGKGTQASPYLILNAAQLQNIQKLDWSSSLTDPYYFKLIHDIDMSGQKWTPLNTTSPYEKRLYFDGNGHIIKNLKIINAGSYASMFGIVLGSVKNLGLVNVDIESSSGHGIGAIAGYVGIKGPSTSAKTGLIENCFSTGVISGADAVGGIAGNIGKPAGSTASRVINCFSTAKVIATSTSGKSRAGGIAGIIYKGGVVQNCFASGDIISKSSSGNGAGGISGWSDSNLKGVVALNTSVTTGANGSAGRISPVMGSHSQGTGCWALDKMVVKKDTTIVPESSYNTGNVSNDDHYDGVSKTSAYLSDMNNYESVLGWDVGKDKGWASSTDNGLPILEWLYERGDYADFY